MARPITEYWPHVHLPIDRSERLPARLGVTCGQHTVSLSHCWLFIIEAVATQNLHNDVLTPIPHTGRKTSPHHGHKQNRNL